MSSPTANGRPDEAVDRCRRIVASLPTGGLFAVGEARGRIAPCRIGPEPFRIPPQVAQDLESQGRLWLALLKASHRLYLKSLRGGAPAWLAEYLELGKPRRVLDFCRMNRFRNQFPVVLRPDMLLTDDGSAVCELDSVPGGIGLLACLSRIYEAEGFPLAGTPDHMVNEFLAAIEFAAGKRKPTTAIVVAEESRMYRPEMNWLAGALLERGLPCRALAPEEVIPDQDGPGLRMDGHDGFVDVMYRFFELFDLANVAGAETFLESAKLRRIRMTPPPKANLEEKLLFALLHHPALERSWEAELGERDFASLRALVIPTWILDPRPVPPHAVVAGLSLGDKSVQSWEDLTTLTQRQRELVVKPSGFSPEAWGSHAVHFGSDLSQEDWTRTVRNALDGFPRGPWILQPHRRPALFRVRFFDEATQSVLEMDSRVRLCPYYFVTGDEQVSLGGVLATACPADKKAIHGMPEAVMLPCSSPAPAGKSGRRQH